MSTSYIQEFLHVSVILQEEANLQQASRSLLSCPWDGEITLDFPSGFSLLTRALGSGKGGWGGQMKENQRDGKHGKDSGWHCWLWRWRKMPQDENAGGTSESWKETRQQNFPCLPIEGCPNDILILAQGDLLQTSALRTMGCCFKSSNV